MKIKILCAGAAAALSFQAHAGVDVGVSIGISQPGVYGRIDIGRYPAPRVVATYPVVVAPPPPRVVVQPVYMWVPPGHRKNWRQHCGAYRACGVPVAFVHDDWYRGHVVHPAYPAYVHLHGARYGSAYSHSHHRNKHHDRDDDRDGHHRHRGPRH